jgi:sodium transport system permease protein
MQDKSSRVLVAGAKGLVGRDDLPPLLDPQQGNRFDIGMFLDPAQWQLLDVEFLRDEPSGDGSVAPDLRREAWKAIEAGKYDAAVYFPPDFADQLQAFRQAIEDRAEGVGAAAAGNAEGDSLPPGADRQEVPSPEILYSTASETSSIAYVRLVSVLTQWTEQIGRGNLAAGGVPIKAAKPFDVEIADVAGETGFRGAAMWSKALPIILLLWAMTGAFYPAVDLCAGEKERGTLETLLSSPAERSEIVVGKLLTVMVFSGATALLNMLSMAVTGWLVISKIPEFGPPPMLAIVWLVIALVPVSAMFSALCLALAAFARSTKEGQYYLMPLLLVTMPLVVLPMAPGVELNLGNSLIPISGLVLLLRSLLEGNYWEAIQFLPPVVVVTLGACLVSIRWAVDQFNSESVLFRESERLDVGRWLKHLLEDRKPTPTVAGAVFCGVVILLVRFFMSMTLAEPEGFRGFAVVALATQLVVIASPALLMTVMLTSSPGQTLLLRRPPWLAVPAAALLAFMLHPSVGALQAAVMRLYPPTESMLGFMKSFQGMFDGVPLWQLLLVIAVVPAICEELAFRGFLLSGFRHVGHKWRAIIYSSLFFGLSHAILQQSIVASVVGTVIAYLAVQSGSIWPGMAFHAIHNGLGVASSRITPEWFDRLPVMQYLIRSPDEAEMIYRWPVILVSALLAVGLLAWFHRLPYGKSDEEREQEAILRGLQAGS